MLVILFKLTAYSGWSPKFFTISRLNTNTSAHSAQFKNSTNVSEHTFAWSVSLHNHTKTADCVALSLSRFSFPLSFYTLDPELSFLYMSCRKEKQLNKWRFSQCLPRVDCCKMLRILSIPKNGFLHSGNWIRVKFFANSYSIAVRLKVTRFVTLVWIHCMQVDQVQWTRKRHISEIYNTKYFVCDSRETRAKQSEWRDRLCLMLTPAISE